MQIKGTKPIHPAPPTLDQQVEKAAKMYEQQFLKEMIRAMRSTVDTEGGIMKPSLAEKIYQDELFEQYAEKWVEGGGNGLAEVIARELKEKILPSQHSRYLPKVAPEAHLKPSAQSAQAVGPVPNKKDEK